LDFAYKHGKITNKDCRTLFPGIADKTAYRDLQDMVDKDILKPHGEKKG